MAGPAAHDCVGRALRILAGGESDVRCLHECYRGLSVPSSEQLNERLAGNAVRFRANYLRGLAAWIAVCAIRHPISALWVFILCSVIFRSLVVRRGHVQLSLPPSVGTASVTLRYPWLHVLLAMGSTTALVLLGRVAFVAALVIPPALFATIHAALLPPPQQSEEVQRVIIEMQLALREAFRSGVRELPEAAEVEDGADGEVNLPLEHGEDMARRVEAIRQKYRPPGMNGTATCRARHAQAGRAEGLATPGPQ